MSRSTHDIDILVVDLGCLQPETWQGLEREGIVITVRRGDADDPLAGAVRLTCSGPAMLDVIVGRSPWQSRVLERVAEREIEGVTVPVAGVADLILLKLYAGGAQDAWDIEQLLAVPDRAAIVTGVEAGLRALPDDAQRLWARITGPR